MLCTASSHFVFDLCRRPFYGCARRLLFVHKETPGTRLCLTIPNCPKSWALISWQFLLVIVLSFTTIDEDSDYYNKKKWVHTL